MKKRNLAIVCLVAMCTMAGCDVPEGEKLLSTESSLAPTENSEKTSDKSTKATQTQNTDKTDDKSTQSSTTKKEEETKDNSSEIMRPEFKEAMDSYEEFMNSYCDFMKKYANSDGTDVNMLTEYTEYMGKYSQVVEDFEKWDDGEMNDVETAYYIEVQARVSKKLLEVGK